MPGLGGGGPGCGPQAQVAAEEGDELVAGAGWAGQPDRAGERPGDVDLAAIRRPALEQRRVNVDFPSWMIESLDREARRLGVTRQSIIKVWIAERLERGRNAA